MPPTPTITVSRDIKLFWLKWQLCKILPKMVNKLLWALLLKWVHSKLMGYQTSNVLYRFMQHVCNPYTGGFLLIKSLFKKKKISLKTAGNIYLKWHLSLIPISVHFYMSDGKLPCLWLFSAVHDVNTSGTMPISKGNVCDFAYAQSYIVIRKKMVSRQRWEFWFAELMAVSQLLRVGGDRTSTHYRDKCVLLNKLSSIIEISILYYVTTQ